MNKANLVDVSLPVAGMSRASCLAHIEKALKDLPGVDQVVVNLGKAEARLRYDATRVDLLEVQQALADIGYPIPTDELILDVRGMTCASCLVHVEGALQDLPGVLSATVNLRLGTARVAYIPGVVGVGQMQRAIRDLGYETGERSGSVDALDRGHPARPEDISGR